MGKYYTGTFDTSGKGKSALTAAAYRGLQAEVYNYTEEQMIAAFHDFAIFFDTIDLQILMHKAIGLEFPIIDLALTLQQHPAPRVIQCSGFCSRNILTNTSFLAGCKHAVALTRVLFLTDMIRLCIDHRLAKPEVYVDDAATITAGPITETTEIMFNSINAFVKMTNRLNCKLCTKGVIMSTIPSSANLIIK